MIWNYENPTVRYTKALITLLNPDNLALSVGVYEWEDGRWLDTGFWKPVAWMPLPEPARPRGDAR